MYVIMMEGGEQSGRLFGTYAVYSGTCRRTARRQSSRGMTARQLAGATGATWVQYKTLVVALGKIEHWLGRVGMAHERLFIECADQAFLDLLQGGGRGGDTEPLHEEAMELISVFKHTVYRLIPEGTLRDVLYNY